MKRKSNFLLIVWAASLLGLSAVRTAHADDGSKEKGYYIPSELAVYETVGDTATITNDSVHALLSPSEFNKDKKSYNLTATYKSKFLFLAFKWEKYPDTDGMTHQEAKVKVFVGNEEVKKLEKTGRQFLSYSDDVYVVPFGKGVDTVRGRVEVEITLYGQITKLTYEAVIVRGIVDDITALRKIWITDSITKENKDVQDVIFKKESGDDGKLKPESQPWEVSFKDLDKKTSDDRGRADTLHFTKYDALSTVKVIVNGKDTLKEVGAIPPTPTTLDSIIPIGHETYKLKIHAGNSYAIEVTARDSLTKGYYYITLLADTLKPPIADDAPGYDTVKLMLKDIYLYEGDDKDNPSRRYTLRADVSGKVGFSEDTLAYKVTAPWSSIKVGYEYYSEEEFNKTQKEVVILKYETEKSGERFIEVRVTKPKNSKYKDKGKGSSGDTTYTIHVLSGDNQLKSLRLSYDDKGTRPLELTRDSSSTVEYTSAAVDYTVASVFAWAAVEDDNASLDGWNHDDSVKNEYWKRLDINKLTESGGGEKTFEVPVRAEDTTLTTIYKIRVKMKWDPTPNGVTFSWPGGYESFTKETLRAKNVFDVKIPANINIEDIDPKVLPSDKDLFRVFETWQVTDGVSSYVVKVTARNDGSTKTYTFNLLRPSNDAFLSHLSVSGFELSPAFDPAITEYTVTVPHDQASIYFVAATRHKDAKVEGDRDHKLTGDSTFSIVVTAEDRTTKTYKVRVTLKANTGIQLPGTSSAQVYAAGRTLHVITPSAERVAILSVDGKLLYSLDKPAGKVSVPGLPKGVLVIKGSSGWVKKAVI